MFEFKVLRLAQFINCRLCQFVNQKISYHLVTFVDFSSITDNHDCRCTSSACFLFLLLSQIV